MNRLNLFMMVFLCTLGLNGQENYSIKNLNENTVYSDFGIAFYNPQTVVFASTRKGNTIVKRVWDGNKQPFLELYKGNLETDGEITEIQNFSPQINTRYHESNAVFTKDQSTVYFTGDNLKNGRPIRNDAGEVTLQLYKARVDAEGKWSAIEKLPFNSDEYNTGHASLNNEENRLYFVSNRPGGFGETDIYWVAVNQDGTYGEPQNLGPHVNTSSKELFPYIAVNNVLYFSTKGFEGLGGLDIFATKIDQNDGTVPVQNLGSPINSEADDFGLVFTPGNHKGYFSSNRAGGKGDDDIYLFEEHQPLQFDCNQLLTLELHVFGTANPIPGAWVELRNPEGEVLHKGITDTSGNIIMNIDCNTDYQLVAGKDEYKNSDTTIRTTDEHEQHVIQKLYLTREEFVSVGDQLLVDIRPIYFDLDKYEIREDAARELEKVWKALLKYPKITIELGSHTDSRARDQYNLILSEKRAEATKNWLVEKGIEGERIKGKGFGESKLVNKCSNGVKCTEAEHQLNRRTEFVIINPEAIKN